MESDREEELVTITQQCLRRILAHSGHCSEFGLILEGIDYWYEEVKDTPNAKAQVIDRFLGRLKSTSRAQRQLALGFDNVAAYESFVRRLVIKEIPRPDGTSVNVNSASTSDGGITALQQLAKWTDESMTAAIQKEAGARFQLLLMLSCADFLKQQGTSGIYETVRSVSCLSKYGDERIGLLLRGARQANDFVSTLVRDGWSAPGATELFVLGAPSSWDWSHFHVHVTEEVRSRLSHLQSSNGYVTRYTIPGLLVQMFQSTGAIPGLFSIDDVHSYFGLESTNEDIFQVTGSAKMEYQFEAFAGESDPAIAASTSQVKRRNKRGQSHRSKQRSMVPRLSVRHAKPNHKHPEPVHSSHQPGGHLEGQVRMGSQESNANQDSHQETQRTYILGQGPVNIESVFLSQAPCVPATQLMPEVHPASLEDTTIPVGNGAALLEGACDHEPSTYMNACFGVSGGTLGTFHANDLSLFPF